MRNRVDHATLAFGFLSPPESMQIWSSDAASAPFGSDAYADSKKKKKKVPTIVVTARPVPSGVWGGGHPGGHTQGDVFGPVTINPDPFSAKEACELAIAAAEAAGTDGFTGEISKAGAAALACLKVKTSAAKIACALAVSSALSACALVDE